MHSVPSNRKTQINQLETVIDVMKNQSEDGKARPQYQTQPIILTGHLNISHVFFSTRMTSPATLITIRLQDSTRHPYLTKSLPLVFEVAKVALC